MYSKMVKNAREECWATKALALSWFHRNKLFKSIDPNKSYAQVVKNTSATVAHTGYAKIGTKNSEKSYKVPYGNTVTSHVTFNQKVQQNSPTVTGVPVKYGKCVPAKNSVPCPHTMIKLCNRFQCLQDCVVGDDVIHSDIHVNNIKKHRDTLTCVNAGWEHIESNNQRSEECKTPHFGSDDMLQPILADRKNVTFEGNKNKTGLFHGESDNIEEPVINSSLSDKQVLSDYYTLHSNCTEQEIEGLHAGMQIGPHLAPGKNSLEGNKNGTGFSDGLTCDTSTKKSSHKNFQTGITAEASNQVATDVFQSILNGNSSLNNSQKLQGDNDCMEVHVNHKHYNVVKNSEHDFGFCPLTDLVLYKGGPVHWDSIPDDLQAYQFIKKTGKPNFLSARIPVRSHLNIDKWREHLTQYWDEQLVDLLQYGFPLDASRDGEFISTEVNHASALQNLHHVQSYLDEELKFNAILGPFHRKPIQLHISPLMVRDKQDSCNKRTIMDLSWPQGASVNTAVQKDVYLGTQYILNYPSIDSITDALVKLGPAALMYKIDISRAFRQIKIDPRDIDLLGIKFLDQYFIDRSVPFGYRNGSQIFQRCSDAIRFTMKQHGFPHLFNYIDDLIYVGLPSNIHASFRFLLKLLQDLGLDISRKKLVAPDTVVTCLGIQIDTVTRTLSIPHKKLQEIASLCKSWVQKTYCSKKALQSLLGSLLYITKCVKPARIFLNRMLALLRDNHNVQKILLNQAFFQDLTWFNTFLSSFNGVTYYDHQLPSAQVHLDACLTGLGGHFDSMVYALPIPRGHENYDICQLEMVNIVVALKIWANHWKNKRIHVFCDNIAVVQVLNTGKARDSILATCARNVWLIAAIFNIELKFSHISGKTNIIADLLSRWSMVPEPHEKLKQMLPQYKWVHSHIDLTALNHDI